MTGATILAPVGPGTGVIPLETADAARWVRVRKVFAMLAEPGVSNLTQALREAGVASSTFYQDLQHPVIRARLTEFIAAVDEASRQLILGRRLEVLHHQQRIASGQIGDPRDSTPAARFLEGVLDKIEVPAEAAEGTSDVARFMTQFKAKSAQKVTARRTTVTEELEFAPDGG
ncbi:hypothetical protein ACFLWA_03775 [Chloroflexota bacterium]